MVVGTKLRDEFKTEPIVQPMERSAYVFDNGKISYGMLQAQNAKICPGFDQVYEKIEKSIPKSRYLGYDANLQRFSTDITRYTPSPKEGCNRGHGLSAAVKLGTPEPKLLQSGHKLTYLTFFWHLIKK